MRYLALAAVAGLLMAGTASACEHATTASNQQPLVVAKTQNPQTPVPPAQKTNG
jgi:ABC-type oligopeptide transport system substrate-binding subunit